MNHVVIIGHSSDCAQLAREVLAAMMRAEDLREHIVFEMRVDLPELKAEFERLLIVEARKIVEPPKLTVEDLKAIMPDKISYVENQKPRDQLIQEKPWLRRRKEKW